MAMAAVGGCWWPIGFEPTWMRGLAQVLPTTWTMQAFNDLMIRHLPAASAAWPFACTMALGLAYVALGLTLHLRRAT
jgi:ABC-2 type transport system permease protein